MKKMIAPIIITLLGLILVGTYFVVIILALLSTDVFIAKLIIVIFALLIGFVIYAFIKNLIERIKEIREENEDDFSKY